MKTFFQLALYSSKPLSPNGRVCFHTVLSYFIFQKLFFANFYCFNYVYVWTCTGVGRSMSAADYKDFPFPRSSYRSVCEPLDACWEKNLCPPSDQYIFLHSEPFLQSPVLQILNQVLCTKKNSKYAFLLVYKITCVRM